MARGHEVKVIHPTKVKPLMTTRSKNNKNDTNMLAELLRARCLEGIYAPPPEVQ